MESNIWKPRKIPINKSSDILNQADIRKFSKPAKEIKDIKREQKSQTLSERNILGKKES